MYQTKFGDAIARILGAYQPGPAMVTALEVLIKTAHDNGRTEANRDVAQEVCEGLHAGPAAGLKCMKCYNAEHHFNEEAVVQAEIEAGRESAEASPDSEVE